MFGKLRSENPRAVNAKLVSAFFTLGFGRFQLATIAIFGDAKLSDPAVSAFDLHSPAPSRQAMYMVAYMVAIAAASALGRLFALSWASMASRHHG